MTDIDKGIYISLHGYLKGAAYEALLEMVDTEAWIASEEGQRAVRATVEKGVRTVISRQFSYSLRDTPAGKKFEEAVTDATMRQLLVSVGAEEDE